MLLSKLITNIFKHDYTKILTLIKEGRFCKIYFLKSSQEKNKDEY